MELTHAAREAMERWLRQQQVRYGGHKPRLEDYGLSDAGVMKDPVFQRYCERYGVECGAR